jgi:response regulator RpfG family c-di-GMP phosphodiesterase
VARTLAARGEAEGRIPIVMVTALTGFCVGETNLAATTGIKRFVFKPCRPRTLVQVVDDAIRYPL